MTRTRNSDRYVTPGVIIAAILTAGTVAAVAAGGVAYLAARGIDPDPMLKLVTTLVGALAAVGTFVLQLVGRPTVAKVERNTGTLAAAYADLAVVATTPPPAPAELGPADDYTSEAPRVPVPPLPDFPRHRRSAS